MNRKIMVIVSSIILIIAVLGLFLNQEDKNKSNQEAIKTIPKQNYHLLKATRDILAGEMIESNDISTEVLEDEENKSWDNLIVDKGKDFVLDSILLRDISKGEFIGYKDIARAGSKEYSALKAEPRLDRFSFGFDLKKREYAILKKLKPDEFVDIYFKYETRNKKNIPILPKRNENQQYMPDGNASSTNLVMMFPHKRVLFLEKNRLESPTQETPQNLEQAFGQLHIELTQEEIKQIYAVENLGHFFIFPSKTSNKNTLATEDILEKDFIKELRGGIDAKNNSQ